MSSASHYSLSLLGSPHCLVGTREREEQIENLIYIYKHTENIAAFSLSEKEKVTKKNQVQVLVLTQVGE